MSDVKLYLIFMVFLSLLIVAAGAMDSQRKTNVEIAAIKAGLVQRVDLTTGQAIWVKPEENNE